jgi:hypothetical protein
MKNSSSIRQPIFDIEEEDHKVDNIRRNRQNEEFFIKVSSL